MDTTWDWMSVSDISRRNRVGEGPNVLGVHDFKVGETGESLITEHININVIRTSDIKANQRCEDMVKYQIKNIGGRWL